MMTHHAFNLLSHEVQLAYTYRQGTHLARRCQAQCEIVNLFELPGRFFVEVTYDVKLKIVKMLLSFDCCGFDSLVNYALFVKLPDWMPEAG